MDEAHVERGLLVATSAVRDAHNGEEFLTEARRITGVEVRILDGNEAQISRCSISMRRTSRRRCSVAQLSR
jgi:exopolyphosphatase/pppGpp-phosphohydrolase